jgi:hypothetical protein
VAVRCEARRERCEEWVTSGREEWERRSEW